jgi:hypothetical protein
LEAYESEKNWASIEQSARVKEFEARTGEVLGRIAGDYSQIKILLEQSMALLRAFKSALADERK